MLNVYEVSWLNVQLLLAFELQLPTTQKNTLLAVQTLLPGIPGLPEVPQPTDVVQFVVDHGGGL
jgi:hypothetical protein